MVTALVRIPGWNALDSVPKGLAPRDFLSEPHSFGSGRQVRWAHPAGASRTHAFRAVMQHQYVVAFRQSREAPSAAELARRLGCSQAVVSRTLSGQRWMGELVQAALVSVLWSPPLPLALLWNQEGAEPDPAPGDL